MGSLSQGWLNSGSRLFSVRSYFNYCTGERNSRESTLTFLKRLTKSECPTFAMWILLTKNNRHQNILYICIIPFIRNRNESNLHTSEQFGINMVLFVSICIQTFKAVSFVIALITKEEIVAIFAHPALLIY